MTPGELPPRFAKKLKVNQESGCWDWQAGVDGGGYGMYQERSRKSTRAHRYSFSFLVSPIPDSMVLDHLCRNRSCVNPDHLEVVTIKENVMRGEGACAENARKTHCVNGHSLSGENIYKNQGNRRVCKVCARDRASAQQKK